MRLILLILSITLNTLITLGVSAAAADADDEVKGVLGGSPPIYVGVPSTGTIETYRSKRHVPPVERPHNPESLRLGNMCATRFGVFGPGPNLPIGEVCAGRAVNGRLIRGQVVAGGFGKFCATDQGIFGPGPEQTVGVSCRVEKDSDYIWGWVSKVDR
jgi:hypothetical protein